MIISKFIWIQKITSDNQINDIRGILANPTVDKEYVKNWCAKLKLFTFHLI